MDINTLLQKLNKSVPGAVLEKTRFGRSDQACLWIDARSLQQVADFMKTDPGYSMDWLENVSVAELGDAWLVTYFLRSRANRNTLILRVSVAVPDHPDKVVDVPSVADIWPMALSQECEIGEMFGFRFIGRGGDKRDAVPQARLPQDWVGFPLRKKYVFPREYKGVIHSGERTS